MDRQPENLALPPNSAPPGEPSGAIKPPRRSNASRWFNYDIFISFALGPPPRGTHSYASDLARRLRELDFTVFFSEDEMSPGAELDSDLRIALHKSKALVVIVNRATLEKPRWIRKEVEEYKKCCGTRPIVPINIDGALQDPLYAATTQEWLAFEGKRWLDETTEAVTNGIVSDELIKDVAKVPRQIKSNVMWRWMVQTTGAALVDLVIGLGWLYNMADTQRREALSDGLAAKAENLSKTRPDQSLLLGLTARRISLTPGANASLRFALASYNYRTVLRGHDQGVSTAQFSPGGKTVLTAVGTRLRGCGIPKPATPWGVAMMHKDAVRSAQFSADGMCVVTAANDNTAYLRDVVNSRQLQAFPGHEDLITSPRFSPDGKSVLTASHDKTARLWDTVSGRQLHVLRGQKEFTSALFSPNGKTVSTTSWDNTARLWDATSGKELQVLYGQEEFTSVRFSDDGKTVVTANWDKTARLWNAPTAKNCESCAVMKNF